MRHQPCILHVLILGTRGEVAYGQCHLESRIKGWSPVGGLFRYSWGQPLHDLVEHCRLHPHEIMEGSLIFISHLHHQSVVDPKFKSSSNPRPYPCDSVSSPTLSSPPLVQDLLELDQLVVVLLKEEGKNFSALGAHGLLSWMSYDRDVNSWTA